MKHPGDKSGNEIWSRCPFCGDSSSHSDKCHFSVNLITGKYYCFRCGFSGVMPHREAATLLITAAIEQSSMASRAQELRTKIQVMTEHLVRGPATRRFSSLERFHVQTGSGKVDVFPQRLPNGKLVGYHCRRSWEKSSENIGLRGLGFHGEQLSSEWVRLVEGPYDAMDPIHDVVTFGLPSKHQLGLLRGIPVVLCPDGDVWTDAFKSQMLVSAVLSCKSLILSGVEVLPDGVDPDELPPKDRKRLDFRGALRLLHSLKKEARPRRAQLDPNYFLPKEIIQ